MFSAAERSSLPSAIDAGALRGERIAAKEDEGLAEAEFEFGGC